MTPLPLERDIEKRIRAYAVSKGCLFEKFVSPAKRGVADRCIIAPGGATGWLEIKRPGGKPTVLQLERLNEKQALGCIVAWCDSVADGCKFVDGLVAMSVKQPIPRVA